MRDNVKIVAILNIVLGCFGVLAGIAVLMIFGGIATFVGVNSNDQETAAAVPVLALIGTGVAIFLFILSIPSIIGGWGMLKFKPWARTLMIIVSALNLLHFPIGTAIGIYGLIILLNDDTRRLFESGGAYVPAPQYAGQAPYGQPGTFQAPAAPTNYPPPPPTGV